MLKMLHLGGGLLCCEEKLNSSKPWRWVAAAGGEGEDLVVQLLQKWKPGEQPYVSSRSSCSSSRFLFCSSNRELRSSRIEHSQPG